MLVLDLVNNYSREIWDGTKKHHDEAVSRVRNFCFHSGNPKLADVDAAAVYNYMRKLAADGLSPATVNRHAAAISSVLKFAREMGEDAADFRIKTKKEKNRLRFFSEDELKRITDYCNRRHVPTWFKDMCNLARYTGMRHSEILKLSDDSQAAVYHDDEGMLWIHLFETKNGDERHIAVLHPTARTACLNLSARRKNTPYNHKEFYKLWAHMRDLIAKGDKQFVFHVFRHTAASHMANELRLNSDVIGQWLGHRNPATTSKYVHIKKATIRDIARQLASSA